MLPRPSSPHGGRAARRRGTWSPSAAPTSSSRCGASSSSAGDRRRRRAGRHPRGCRRPVGGGRPSRVLSTCRTSSPSASPTSRRLLRRLPARPAGARCWPASAGSCCSATTRPCGRWWRSSSSPAAWPAGRRRRPAQVAAALFVALTIGTYTLVRQPGGARRSTTDVHVRLLALVGADVTWPAALRQGDSTRDAVGPRGRAPW